MPRSPADDECTQNDADGAKCLSMMLGRYLLNPNDGCKGRH